MSTGIGSGGATRSPHSSAAGASLLQACLFLSGGSSLILEVAWSRALALSLGNSHQAVATVVASMMAGLCIGSVLAARALPGVKALSRAYGRVEMGIGAYSALTLVIFRILPFLLAPLHSLPSLLFSSVRFVLVFLVLLPPTCGMGATLPLVTAAIAGGRKAERAGEKGRGSVGGRLYGLNTLGAFLGTVAGGFLLLPELGLLRTTLLSSGTSFGIGVLAFLFTDLRTEGASEEAAAPARGGAGRAAWILPLYAASGCLAMIYEVTWTRSLAPFAGASVYSFALILAAVLSGMGLGSLVLSARRAGGIDPARSFAAGQFLLAAAAFASTWGIGVFPDLLARVAAGGPSRPGIFFLWEFVLFGSIVLLPAMVLGSLFPLAARILEPMERSAGSSVGRVYAWNTAGSIAGALAAGFILVEAIGSERTLVLASAASALLGVASLPLAQGRRFRASAALAGVGLAAAFPFLVPSWDLYKLTTGITQVLRVFWARGKETSASEALAANRAPDARLLFHREGKTSTVTVVREKLSLYLRVDGRTNADTTDNDMRTQILLGQLPFFFARHREEACVIGLGSGVTSHSALTHGIRRLDSFEIERQVAEASHLFEPINGTPLSDPRHHLVLEDARTALLYLPRKYDVIISQPSNPWMAGVNNLFTEEFYHLVRKRLNPGGVFCQWIQGYEMSEESVRTLLETLADTFPRAAVFSSFLGTDILVIASDEPLSLAPGAADLFPDRPEVAKDLARIGIRTLADLAIRYTAPVPLPTPGRVLNTDDNSRIQYRAPLDMLLGREPRQLRLALSIPGLLQLFFPGGDGPKALDLLAGAAERLEDPARMEEIAGLLEQRGGRGDAREIRTRAEALRGRLAARGTVDDLLQQAEQRLKEGDRGKAGAAVDRAEGLGLDSSTRQAHAGYILLSLGRPAEAEMRLDDALRDENAPPFLRYQALAGRGAARIRAGRRQEGLADLAAAEALDPDHPLAYLMLGRALASVGEKDSALRELSRGLERVPGDRSLRAALSQLGSGHP